MEGEQGGGGVGGILDRNTSWRKYLGDRNRYTIVREELGQIFVPEVTQLFRSNFSSANLVPNFSQI